MIIETLNRNQFQANKASRIDELREELINVQKRSIRKAFDNTRLDSTALACVDVAREFGFDELAVEMENDFETELALFHHA